ncbi:MAG: hypothetical protein AB7F82_04390, partial [Alphaproteobacteria bacterium]
KDDWDTAVIYRPYFDLRRCTGTPSDSTYNMTATYDWETGTVLTTTPPDPSVIYQAMTQKVDTNLWAMCVNSGYDPPAHYGKDYKGPQTGALTDTTLCHAAWWTLGIPDIGCSSTADENEMFPEP